jgi:acyl-CoA dehydrogenase
MALDNDTLEQLLDVVRRFVRKRLIPNEAAVSETDQIPAEIVDDMKAIGLFGLSIPEEYGGLGLTMEEEVRVVFEVCHAAPVFRSMFGTNVGFGSLGIVIDGTEDQKRAYLPVLASGEMIASFALTEPDAGSDSASIRTHARRDGDDFVLNGTKRYITNAPEADIFTVMARTDLAQAGGRGISAFIVRADTPGLALGKNDRKMGQHGAHTCDVIFDDCKVPATSIIGGQAGRGFKTAMKVLDKGRLHIAAVCTGLAERALDDALAYAMTPSNSASRSPSFNSSRRCWRTARQRSLPPARWCWKRRAPEIPASGSVLRPRVVRCSRARCSGGSSIVTCRSTVAPGTSRITPPSGCTATRGCSGSSRGRPRSSNS